MKHSWWNANSWPFHLMKWNEMKWSRPWNAWNETSSDFISFHIISYLDFGCENIDLHRFQWKFRLLEYFTCSTFACGGGASPLQRRAVSFWIFQFLSHNFPSFPQDFWPTITVIFNNEHHMNVSWNTHGFMKHSWKAVKHMKWNGAAVSWPWNEMKWNGLPMNS